MNEMPNGYNMSALCPMCNNVYSASRLYQTGFVCPCCGKKIPKSSVIFAFTEEQSYDLACALRDERK